MTVPSIATIADGESSAEFEIAAIDNSDVESDQLVDIAGVAGEVVASGAITILEDDEEIVDDGDQVVTGTSEDDVLNGGDDDDVLIGLRGDDILNGSAGDDVFFTDEVDGDANGNDRDIIRLGDVDANDIGNDVVRDFDTNSTNGGENSFDTLEFTFAGEEFSLSTANEILDFIEFIESDGNNRTDALRDGDDLIFVFARDSQNPDIITQSIRLEDVITNSGLTSSSVNDSSVNEYGGRELDIIAVDGDVAVSYTHLTLPTICSV